MKRVMLVESQSFYKNMISKKILEKSQGGSYEISVEHIDAPSEEAVIKYFDLQPDLLIWGIAFDSVEKDMKYLELILEKTNRVIVLIPTVMDTVISRLNDLNVKSIILKPELIDNLKFNQTIDLFFPECISLEDMERYEKESKIMQIQKNIQPNRKKSMQNDSDVDEIKPVGAIEDGEEEIAKVGFFQKIKSLFK